MKSETSGTNGASNDLRRASARVATRAQEIVAGISLDQEGGLAKRNGRVLRIGAREFIILRLLVQNPERTFSREELRSLVWPDEPSIDLRTVDVKVHRLRNALKLQRAPDPVASVRGIGYRLKATCGADYEKWYKQLEARRRRRSVG